jgi:tRNA(fMet)-specific endonuclease VapC
MPLYMLDTETASYVMKGTNSNVVKRLRALPTDATCISAIVESELRFGIAVSPRRQRDQEALDEFLAYMQVLDYPAAASADYGLIRGDLKQRGAIIGANDLLIAAHARHLGLTLVTNNTREFSRVPGLKVENWA